RCTSAFLWLQIARPSLSLTWAGRCGFSCGKPKIWMPAQISSQPH
ncbi:MAG: hypothetical protein ACI9G6_001671, partial [Limisphaerales bacterium]